jgi:hypothetical protein
LKPNEYPSTEAKEITIIQSQMLNSKQEVIIPTYKNPKIMAFALILLLIISGFAVYPLNGNDRPSKMEKVKKGK